MMNQTQKSFVSTAMLAMLLGTPSAAWEAGKGAAPSYYRRAESRNPETLECEVAVYGGTPAGVTAAIQAARMGRKTLLLSFNQHVGGMTSGGLTASDHGKKESIGDFCQRVVVLENGRTTVRNEGGFGHPFPKPFPVSYRAIVPMEAECANLLVPVCLSSSHVAYGSIRMEPVFMIIGQSAGMAAAIAIGEGVEVQRVDYGKLRRQLLEAGQRL